MKRRFILALILVGVACLIGIIYALFIHKELVVKTFDKEISILVHNEYNDPEIIICYGTIIKCKKLELEK